MAMRTLWLAFRFPLEKSTSGVKTDALPIRHPFKQTPTKPLKLGLMLALIFLTLFTGISKLLLVAFCLKIILLEIPA